MFTATITAFKLVDIVAKKQADVSFSKIPMAATTETTMEIAEKAFQNFTTLACEVSDKINAKASKLRRENKETCDRVDTLCGGIAAFLAVAWASVLESMASAFFPHIFVTFALNAPPLAYGLASAIAEECNSRWLLFNAFLAAIHMVTCVYVVVRIRGEEPPSTSSSLQIESGILGSTDNGFGITPYVQATTASRRTTSPNSWERISKVLFRDLTMACYYVLCLLWIIWQVIGTRRLLRDNTANACNNWLSISVLCGRLYLCLGPVAWIFSLCFVRYNKLKEEDSNSQNVLTLDDNDGVGLA